MNATMEARLTARGLAPHTQIITNGRKVEEQTVWIYNTVSIDEHIAVNAVPLAAEGWTIVSVTPRA